MADKKAKVLLVEDEEMLRDVMIDYLAEIADIDTAADGKDGWTLAIAGDYDVIVSDIAMPKMTGLELLEKLRDNGVETPFIVCTSYSDKENSVAALRLGAFDFLEKPVNCDMLHESVKRAISQKQANDEVETELDEMVVEFRRKQKAVLMMRKNNELRKKKKSA